MSKKRKIIVTESQFEVIKESENVITDFNEWADDIIKVINAQFGRLAFATLADILDGDVDLEVIKNKIDQVNKVQHSKFKRVEDYFNNHTSEDEYWEKWEGIHRKIEDRNSIITNKVDIVEQMVNTFINLVNMDAEKHFSDIDTRKI